MVENNITYTERIFLDYARRQELNIEEVGYKI